MAVELVFQLALAVTMVGTMVPITQVVTVEQEMDVDPMEVVRVVILAKMLQGVLQET